MSAAPVAKDSEKKGFDPKKLIGMILVTGNLAGLGGGAFLTYKNTIGHESTVLREPAALQQLEKDRAAEEKDGSVNSTYSLTPFTVNLTGNPQRILRVEMTLDMLDQDGFEEVVRLGPQSRDAIVKILSEKQFSDVETVQGKLFLKDQIAVSLNKFLKTGVVKDVYFSNFDVQ